MSNFSNIFLDKWLEIAWIYIYKAINRLGYNLGTDYMLD
jgi:hypothetical protein